VEPAVKRSLKEEDADFSGQAIEKFILVFTGRKIDDRP
jgi:hypothetical protein